MSVANVDTIVDITSLAQEQNQLTMLLDAKADEKCSTGTEKIPCDTGLSCLKCELDDGQSDEAQKAFKDDNDLAVKNGQPGVEYCVAGKGAAVTKPADSPNPEIKMFCGEKPPPNPSGDSALFLDIVTSVFAATMVMHLA